MRQIPKTELSPDNGAIIDTKWKVGPLSYHACAAGPSLFAVPVTNREVLLHPAGNRPRGGAVPGEAVGIARREPRRIVLSHPLCKEAPPVECPELLRVVEP